MPHCPAQLTVKQLPTRDTSRGRPALQPAFLARPSCSASPARQRYRAGACTCVALLRQAAHLSIALTPTADTNGIGCHDPLPDKYKLSPQVSDGLGHLCGTF
jgi:hypothetical protein